MEHHGGMVTTSAHVWEVMGSILIPEIDDPEFCPESAAKNVLTK